MKVLIRAMGRAPGAHFDDLVRDGTIDALYTLNNGPTSMEADIRDEITHYFDIHDTHEHDHTVPDTCLRLIGPERYSSNKSASTDRPLVQKMRTYQAEFHPFPCHACTITYMLEYAILRGATEIYLAGLDYHRIAKRKEMELPTVMFWLGVAHCSGIKIHAPPGSVFAEGWTY